MITPSTNLMKGQDVVKYIASYQCGVSIDAMLYTAEDLRNIISTARRYNVLVHLRNSKFNPKILSFILGQDGKSVIMDMQSVSAGQSAGTLTSVK